MIATASSPQPPRLLVTQEEASAMLSVGVRTVQRWTADGSLPCVRVGAGRRRLLRYAVADLEAFCNGLRQGGNEY